MISDFFDWLLITGPVPVLGLIALILFAVLLLRSPVDTSPASETDTRTPFSRLKHTLGADNIHAFWFNLALLLWATVFVMLLAGLLVTIWAVVAAALPADMTSDEGKVDVWEFRFLIAKLGGLTAVLGVVVALPFTVIRLRISNEDNETKKAALLNDKINSALEDLHSMRQISVGDQGNRETIWEPHITRRNGAIDRLEALAQENPRHVARISRTLATYLRELSREHAAVALPDHLVGDAVREWAREMRPARSDMENAGQTIGRLTMVTGTETQEHVRILEFANMQGFRLASLNFKATFMPGANLEGAVLQDARLDRSNLVGAHLEGANLKSARLLKALLTHAQMAGAVLREAWMEGANLEMAWMEAADLRGARMNEKTILTGAITRFAAVNSIDLSRVNITQEQVNAMFGDASVVLPNGIERPRHWPDTRLNPRSFQSEWQLYKSDPDAYVPPQDRD